jgi:amino acid transporter
LTNATLEQRPITSPISRPSSLLKKSQKLTLWPLVAATFFMVSGGTYGTEDIIGGSGFARGILILLITPVLWSLPTSLMIGELASAMPEEGGYYAWVRRAMGNLWGFQEAWLSLVASIFDMAIYPTLFVTYLTKLFPYFGIGHRGILVALAIVVVCAAMNIAGIRVVATSSVWLFVLLSIPFLAIVVLAPWKHGAFALAAGGHGTTDIGIIGGILICMWNYMGWDNATTVAGEVHNPQRTYPRAMAAAVAIVAISYTLPFAAMWLTGIGPQAFGEGAWADIAGMLGGPGLRIAIVVGGMMSAFGMFNALVMSYSRLPLAMAQDGLMPHVFTRMTPRTRAPWVAIVACAVAWAMCLGLGFERLVTIDILLYGMSLGLEFVALIVLRIKAPDMPRPYKVPGGMLGVIALSIVPMALLGFSVVQSKGESVMGINALLFGLLVIAGGFVAYGIKLLLKPTGWFVQPVKTEFPAA